MACTAPTITVGGVTLSTSDFENSAELVNTVSSDNGDPTLDEHDENIANGNNTQSKTGVQIPATAQPAMQTTLPPPISAPATKSVVTPPRVVPPVATTSTVWSGSYDEQLSTNYKVRHFTINAVFKNELITYTGSLPPLYAGQGSIDARFNCLKALAINVAEPMRAKFGALNINSALRNKSSTKPDKVSQHILGQAMDIQFAGWTYARYWENAAWVKDNIPYDQFIYEHSDKTGLVWYHLSFKPSGNRPVSDASKIMTMYRNQYSPGLHSYG
jgi:hypothetical protein